MARPKGYQRIDTDELQRLELIAYLEKNLRHVDELINDNHGWAYVAGYLQGTIKSAINTLKQ